MKWARLLTTFGAFAVVLALVAGVLLMNPGAMYFVLVAVVAFELAILLPIAVIRHLLRRGKVVAPPADPGVPWWEPPMVRLAMAGIVAMPALTKDRSCHNHFRDVSTYNLFSDPVTMRSKVNLTFPAGKQDWNGIARFLVAFGRQRGMDVKDMTEEDEHSKQLFVSLCNESGTAIEVLDRIYHFGPAQEAAAEQSVRVFGIRPESDYQVQAAALEVALRAIYGDRLRREDPPVADVTEVAQRLKAVLERPRFSIDELHDAGGLAQPCRKKRVHVRHLASERELHEFEVSCEGGSHRFVVGTRVETHNKIRYTTRTDAGTRKSP